MFYSSSYDPITEWYSSLNWTNISFLSLALSVFSLSIVKHINQSFKLLDMPAFKMSSYYKLKISYVIKLVIIKHA